MEQKIAKNSHVPNGMCLLITAVSVKAAIAFHKKFISPTPLSSHLNKTALSVSLLARSFAHIARRI